MVITCLCRRLINYSKTETLGKVHVFFFNFNSVCMYRVNIFYLKSCHMIAGIRPACTQYGSLRAVHVVRAQGTNA